MNKKSNLAICSAIYAVIYTFCLYKNLCGITFPVFALASVFFFSRCAKEFSLTIKKDSNFLIGAILLISISQPLTSNEFINTMNVFITFALLICYVMHLFLDDSKWDFFKYITNIITTFFSAFLYMFSPIKDYSERKKDTDKKSAFPWKTVLLSVLGSIPALLIIVMLLSDADVVFENVINRIFENWNFSTQLKIAILTVLVFLISYGLISFLLKRSSITEISSVNNWDSVIAITVGTLFDFIYVVFCVIQILYLFIGKFSLPEGTSYAEYAREGFFQLLFVCVFNLVMVIIGSLKFNENKALKIILSIASGCTFIMIASSAFRMILYIRFYYFSFLRVLVLWALFTIMLLMAGVVVSIWKPGFNLFKYVLVTASVLYIILAFSHVDYFVAKWNLGQSTSHSDFFIAESDYNDMDMFLDMSYDASPIVFDYLEKAGKTPDNSYNVDIYYSDATSWKAGIRNFNLSRYIALKKADKFYSE